jgi:hypothetical protein
MYSLTQPALAESWAIDVAGTAAVERTRAGSRFLVFIARDLLMCAKDVVGRLPIAASMPAHSGLLNQ